MSDYIGIDYSGGDGSNVDPETGIHYGIIPVHDLDEWAWDNFEADYGDPTCPNCGNTATDYDSEDNKDEESYKPLHSYSCTDYLCNNCHIFFGSDEAFGDEPLGWTLDDGEYTAFINSYNDVWIFKSPYFTYAQFCSPCAPGAGHLSNPRSADSGAPKVYCFGPDWFEGDKAPYDVFAVKTPDRGEKD